MSKIKKTEQGCLGKRGGVGRWALVLPASLLAHFQPLRGWRSPLLANMRLIWVRLLKCCISRTTQEARQSS